MPNEMRLGSEEEAEEAEFIVCMVATDPLAMPDNKVGACSQCGCAVQHRPHNPPSLKMICAECALPILERKAEADELEVVVTPKTAEELAVFMKKQSMH